MPWLRSADISHAWRRTKHFMGNAYTHTNKFIGTVDKYADIAGRLLGAASPLLSAKALQMGAHSMNQYKQLRSSIGDIQRGVDNTVQRVRSAVPELEI